MEVLSSVFQSILNLGAAVFLPIVMFIIGVVVGLKPSKAISAGLTLGVALVGINMVISFMSDTVGVAAQAFVEHTGIQLTALDMGWAPAISPAWAWPYAFLMFPIQIGINVIMLVFGWTKTLNVDMWNVVNKIFTAFIVTFVTGNVALGFAFAAVEVVLELKSSDNIKNQVTELTGVPGVGMPHPIFLSNIFFYPLARVLDRILPESNKIDAAALKKKLGIFGENHVLGFIVGTAIGLLGGQGAAALMTGVQAGCALTLFPMVSKLFMTALAPISDAANKFVKKHFGNREMVIGLDWPILAGNPEIWVTIILTIPVALLVAVFLPGNTVLPFGNLMTVAVAAPVFIACKGDLRKMVIISFLFVPIFCWSATAFAPIITELQNQAGGSALAAGQMIGWWGMDDAEIRWALIEAVQLNPAGIAALVVFGVLAFFYFRWQKVEEHNAAVRMGWIEEDLLPEPLTGKVEPATSSKAGGPVSAANGTGK